MALKGQLQHFGLGEVFQALALSKHTGSLVVQSGRDRKTIYFSDGLVTLVSSGGAMRFGEILIREHKVSQEQIREAVEEQRASGKLMGRILVEKGLIAQEDVDRALKKKIEEELYDLFLWETGNFEFLAGQAPPELLDPRIRHTQVRIDPNSVLLEGMRQLDEWKIIQSRLPDTRAILRKEITTPPADVQLDTVESHLWMQIPSEAAVTDILEQSLDTRFATLKVLYRFVEEGWLSVLNGDQSLELARRLAKDGDPKGAKEIYDYLLEKVSAKFEDPEFLVECGSFLIASDERVQGGETLLRAVHAYETRGELAKAWESGFSLFERGTPTLELLRTLWQVRDGAPGKAMRKVRDALLERLIKQQKHLDIDELVSSCPDEFSESRHLFARGRALRALKRDGEAVEVLTAATRIATQEDNLAVEIEIASLILDIDPSRTDVKRRLKSLLEMQQVKEQRAKRRFTFVAIGLGVAFLLAVVPMRYEMKARESFQKAHMTHVAFADSREYPKIISAYQEVVDQYPLSTRASLAQEEITRLLAEQEKQARALAAEDIDALEKVRKERERKLKELSDLKLARQVALQKRKMDEARQITQRIIRDYQRLLLDETIPFAVLIDSNPKGAELSIDGKAVGVTPFVHEFESDAQFEVSMRFPGYEPFNRTLSATDPTHYVAALERGAAARAQLGAEFGGEALLVDDSMVITGRDGSVYSLPLDFMNNQWVQWRQRVGVHGHPAATVVRTTSGDLIVAAVSGDLKRINRNGTVGWSKQGQAAWTTKPALGTDGEYFAIGDDAGQTVLLRTENGGKIGSHRAGFPIDLIAIQGSTLLSADRALYLRRFELPSMELKKTEVLPSRAKAWLDGLGLLLADGTLITDTERRQVPAPATRLRESLGRFTYGTADGKWVLLDGDETMVGDAGNTLSCPPLLVGDCLLLPGDDNLLRCRTRSGVERWAMKMNERVLDQITADERSVFVFTERAKVLLIEEDGS